MGRGDKRTKKGKINRGSYGKCRRPSNRTKKEVLVPFGNKPAPSEVPVKPEQGQPQAAPAQD